MAFLRETPRSLRAYFLVAGVLATAGAVFAFVNVLSLPRAYLAGQLWAIAPTLLYGLDLLYAGVRFRALVFGNPRHLERLVYASLGAVALQLIVDAAAHLDVAVLFGKAAVGLSLSLYLLTNVRRLTREAGVPPND